MTSADSDSSGAPLAVHRALANPGRAQLLELLREHPDGLGATEIAQAMRVHPNTARANVAMLVDAGLVAAEREPRSDPGRPKIVFRATAGEADPPARAAPRVSGYRLLAAVLARALASSSDAESRAIAAGEAWGRYLIDREEPHDPTTGDDAVAHLLRLLEVQGFAPEINSRQPGDASTCTQPEGTSICMRRCPFGDLAQVARSVVCAVHLGLLRGALSELRSPIEVHTLVPFVEPGRCVADLGPANHLAARET